jgi:hypothetical protein
MALRCIVQRALEIANSMHHPAHFVAWSFIDTVLDAAARSQAAEAQRIERTRASRALWERP